MLETLLTAKPKLVESPPGEWVAVETVSGTPRWTYNHQIAILNGKMYVIGGYPGSQQINIYDLLQKSWTMNTSVLANRYYHTAGVLGNYIYVLGGSGKTDLQLYIPDTNTWWVRAGIGQRYSHCSGVIGNDLFMFGGYAPSNYSNELLVYSLLTNKWLNYGTSGPQARVEMAGCCANGKFYVHGGYGPGPGYLDDLWEFNPVTGLWRELAKGPIKRRYHRMVSDGRRLFIYGGYHRDNNVTTYLNDFWMYDPDIDQWTELTELSPGRYSYGMAFYEGAVYIFSGHGDATLTDFWKYHV